MMEFQDQMDRRIRLEKVPERIVSLVPSQTEFLVDIGLEEQLVGITKFCIHPEKWFRSKTRVGGTKKLDLEKIRSLEPDLIIGNKEENDREQIELLEKEFPVWMSDVRSLHDAILMMQWIGEITGTSDKAIPLIKRILEGFKEYELPEDLLTAAYFIWRDPLMVVGADTFISDMMLRAGFINSFNDVEERYRTIDPQDVLDRYTDILLLSSEPYPFKEQHVKEFEEMHAGTPATLVDGEMFSWYGSRLKKAVGYLQGLAAG